MEQRILAQLLVVVDIFIAQSQPVDSLRNHVQDGMISTDPSCDAEAICGSDNRCRVAPHMQHQ